MSSKQRGILVYRVADLDLLSRWVPALQMFLRTYINSWQFHRHVSNQFHIGRTSFMSTFTVLRAIETSRDRTSEPRISTTKAGNTQYRLIEDIEDLDRYQPGGYHPVQMGDELDGRYRLVDKLGYGGYSTIWLARDLRMARYVAVKIITADTSDSTHEASLIDALGNSTCRPGGEILRPLIDEFWVSGPNGASIGVSLLYPHR